MRYWGLSKGLFGWLLLFLLLPAAVPAQESTFVRLKETPELSIPSGTVFNIQLYFLIREGFHIQAHQVKDENLIPTAVTFTGPDELHFGTPVFPGAEKFTMKGTVEPLEVYSDTLVVSVPVATEKSPDKKMFLVRGRLSYQACDDAKCYYPRNLDFTLTIHLE
jgi:hypothetical protein